MKVAKNIVINELCEEYFQMTLRKDVNLNVIYTSFSEKYNYPSNKIHAILSRNIPVDFIKPEEVFWLSDILLHKKIKDYFTEKEIKKFSSMRYEEKEFKDLSIPCLEVVEGEQWIGVLQNAPEFFARLRISRKIHYNPNAQRAMTMEHLKNGKTLWRITLNKTVLKKIRQCFNSNKFIPNTITLNIDPDTDTELVYQDGMLEINNLDHFDITDGFHRFMALCKEWDNNSDFSYPMEIRITRFSDDKASYFVWQEDQKTPMKRKDAATLNLDTVENKIIRRLNDSEGCLQDNIGRNNSLIQMADLNEAIKKIYVKPKQLEKIPYDKAEFIKNTSKEINRKWNSFVEKYPDAIENGYTPEKIMKIVKHCKNNTVLSKMYKDVMQG